MERKRKYYVSRVRFRGFFVVDRETDTTLGPFEQEVAEHRCEVENARHEAEKKREATRGNA